MAFGDFIRAVKADLKHDDSIVEDYDWNRLMSFKELDIKRFDELVDIIKNYQQSFKIAYEFAKLWEYRKSFFIHLNLNSKFG